MIPPPVCEERDLKYGAGIFDENRALLSLERFRCLKAAVKQVVG